MHIVVSGGAGYIGSMLTSELLLQGHKVTVIDKMMFGGDSLLAFLRHPRFTLHALDLTETRIKPYLKDADVLVHLPSIVGFPACQAVGKAVTWRYNVDLTREAYEDANAMGVKRFIFASTYSNYGLAPEGEFVDEESPLNPQSLYAESKIASERLLLDDFPDATCVPIILRFATLFGISPRTRFDLIVNQFVLEALTKRELIIYQRGYARSFIHVYDIARAIMMMLDADESIVGREIFNVGATDGNYTKDQIVKLVQKHIPATEIKYKDLSFGGDMRDIRVSFEKIHSKLGFVPVMSVEDGVIEVRDVIKNKIVRDPLGDAHRNAKFIVQ